MKRTLTTMTFAALLAIPSFGHAEGLERAVQPTALTGSWLVRVEPDPSAGIPAFRELVTFSSDGNILVVDDNAPAPPFPFTYGVGVWERVYDGNARVWHATFHYLLYDPATFASAGKATVHRTLNLDDGPDDLTGGDQITVEDADGQVLFTSSGTLSGRRIKNDSF